MQKQKIDMIFKASSSYVPLQVSVNSGRPSLAISTPNRETYVLSSVSQEAVDDWVASLQKSAATALTKHELFLADLARVRVGVSLFSSFVRLDATALFILLNIRYCTLTVRLIGHRGTGVSWLPAGA